MTRDESLWLVKSSGRILGPCSTSKVAELLRTREISVLDEIALPARRWLTLQYHEEFRDVVDSLRKASLSERTEVTWSAGTNGQTQTLTSNDNAGELTEELPSDALDFGDGTREIVIHDVPELSPTKPSGPPTIGRYQTPAQSTAINAQVEKTTRGLWWLTALVLFAAVAFIVQRRVIQSPLDARASLAAFRQEVQSQVQVGHYVLALTELKSYFADPLQSGDLAIYYGSLLIQVENQTVLGRRLLTSYLAAHKNDTKQALTALGVADMIDGQLDAAKEGFNKILQADPDYVPALVNQAVVGVRRGDFATAQDMLSRVQRLSPYQGEALVLATQIALQNKTDYDAISRRIGDFRKHSWDFAGELAFYDLYLAQVTNSPRFDAALQAFLDGDPRLTADHRHNVFIYHGFAQWKTLGPLCDQLVETLGEAPRASLLATACAARQMRWDDARRAVDKAVHQTPKDALAQAWYSYVLRESGDADQAGVVLGRATEFNRHGEVVLPTLMQARFCQTAGLVECARDNWKNLFERDQDNLPAVAGMAWANAQLKSTAEAAKLINRGLKLSPDYIPLLELKAKAEAEGWYAAN